MYKRKKKKTELSSQIPFSYPSALPNGFSLISSRREVKSKTKTNRVHWCVVRSALIGEFQDLPHFYLDKTFVLFWGAYHAVSTVPYPYRGG